MARCFGRLFSASRILSFFDPKLKQWHPIAQRSRYSSHLNRQNSQGFSTLSTASTAVINRLRNATSLTDLKAHIALIKPTKGGLVFIGELPLASFIYIFKVIENSNRLTAELTTLDKLLGIELKESVYCYSLITSVLKSIRDRLDTGVSIPCKHMVGIIWHLLKICNQCITSETDCRRICIEKLPQLASGNDLDFEKLLLEPVDIDTILSISLLTLNKTSTILLDMFQLLEYNLGELNGLDLQQMVMSSCEPCLSLNCTADAYNIENAASKKVFDDTVENLNKLKQLMTDVAIKRMAIFMDDQLVNTFVSCYRRPLDSRLKTAFLDGIDEASKKGLLNIHMKDLVQFLIAAKSYPELEHATRILLTQLEYCVPPGNHPASSKMINTRATLWQQWLQRVTLEQLGKLSKALFTVELKDRVLTNIDATFDHILSRRYIHGKYALRNIAELPSNVQYISNVLHLFAKYDKHNIKSLGNIHHIIKLEDCLNAPISQDVMYDLCWSLCTLKVDLDALCIILSKLLLKMHTAPLKWNVKLLGGIINYTRGVINFKKDPSVHFVLSKKSDEVGKIDVKNLMDDLDQLRNNFTSTDSGFINRALINLIDYIKINAVERLEEFDNIQTLSNFFFYIASTVDNFSLQEYAGLADAWINIAESNKALVKIEAIAQVMWALQKNRIYHQRALRCMHKLLMPLLPTATGGQLGLTSYTLAYYNMLEGEAVDLYIKRLEQLVKDKRLYENIDQGCNKFVSVLWALALSDFSKIDARMLNVMIELLPKLNWDGFLRHAKAADLRRILQVASSLEFDLGFDVFQVEQLVPARVIDAAQKGSKILPDYGLLSVSQDKVRRALERYQVNFRGEYSLVKGLTVDFALSNTRDDDSATFKPDLIMEVDGPYHYAIISGDCDFEPSAKIGDLSLVENGKTLHRNRMVAKAGYKLEAIPWLEAYKTPLHEIIKSKLLSNGYTNVKL